MPVINVPLLSEMRSLKCPSCNERSNDLTKQGWETGADRPGTCDCDWKCPQDEGLPVSQCVVGYPLEQIERVDL